MSIEDRDYYRADVKAKTAGHRKTPPRGDNLLQQVVTETARRKRGRRPLIALTWIAFAAILYALFSVSGGHH